MLLKGTKVFLLLSIPTFAVGFEIYENINSVQSSIQMEQHETQDTLIRARSATSTGNKSTKSNITLNVIYEKHPPLKDDI